MNAIAGHPALEPTADSGPRRPLRVLTGFEASPGHSGEVEYLITDLYTGTRYFDARVYGAPLQPAWSGVSDLAARIKPLPITVSGWNAALSDSIQAALADESAAGWMPEAVHCHQLSSPQAAACAAVHRDLPHIGFLHPSDLARAAVEPARREALHRTADAMDVIIAPTEQLARGLRRAAPGLRAKIVTLPWGIPDHLVDMKVFRPQPRGRTRVIHVGALTRASGVLEVVAALSRAPAIEIILVGPRAAYDDLRQDFRRLGAMPVHHDLTRDRLWELLADVDFYVHTEAQPYSFARAPLEAQALGVLVFHPAGSGMSPILRGAIGLDFTEAGALRDAIDAMRSNPRVADSLRVDGRRNAAQYRLSATVERLNLESLIALGRLPPNADLPAQPPKLRAVIGPGQATA